MSDTRIRRAVYALFFLSGACGLIYQIIWTRMMTITFGITVYAVSTVLCSFMAGLALGSYFFGRKADTVARPLALYGWLEIGIGLFALLFPTMLKAAEPLFIEIHRHFYQNYHLFSLLRFLVIFPLLIVPTFLMGGTFPLVSRYFVRGGGTLGRDVGFLYAVNTTGAVVGTFLVGFVLLAYAGMWWSTVAAAALNIIVGVGAIAVGRATPPAEANNAAIENAAGEDEPDEAGHAAWSAKASLVAIGLSGFASLGLEVLWTRILVFHTHNSTYAFSAMLLAFLLGIAAGGWIYGMIADRVKHPLILFAALEFGIAAWSIASLKLVGQLPHVTEFLAESIHWNNWFETVVIILSQVLLILFVPTLLMGMTFPLATRLAARGMNELGRKIGDVYAANTFGTVLGSLITGFALIPLFGVRTSFIVIAGVNALTAAGLLIAARGADGALRGIGVLLCVATIAAAQFKIPKDAILNDFKRALGEVKFFEEEVTDTVMVVDLFSGPRENRVPNKDFRMLVFADGRGTAGHPTVAEDRFYAHLPLLLHPDPKEVLNICIGAGNTIGATLQHLRVCSVTAVDLSPGVVDASKFFETNYGSINNPRDPRLNIVVEDGRNYLLGTDRKFDIIHLDPPEFHTAGVVFLYTEEFYRLVREHLKPGGIFSHWFNASKLSAEEMRQVCATFHKVFPDGTDWQSPGLYSMNFIGSDGPIRVPVQRAMEIYNREPKVRASFEDVKIGGPLDLFSYLLMDSKSLGTYSAGAPIMTDDKTRVDFTNPKSSYSGFGFIHLYSPADMTKFYKLTDAEKAERRSRPVPDGGWQHMTGLTLKSDDATELADWTGCTPEQQAEYEKQIRANTETRKARMQEYLKAQMAGW